MEERKKVKPMLILVLAIPVAMFLIGIIQTFVLKDKQSSLLGKNQIYSTAKNEFDYNDEAYEYITGKPYNPDEDPEFSENYKNQNSEHNYQHGENSESDDIIVIIK